MAAPMIPILCPSCGKPTKVSVVKGTSSYFDPAFKCACGHKKLYWSPNKEKTIRASTKRNKTKSKKMEGRS